MFGSTGQVLFDSGAVTNVIAASLCSQLHLQPHNQNRRMGTVDEFEATVLGEIDKVPITVGGMTHAVTVLVVNDARFRLVIGKSAIKLCEHH